MGFRPQDFPNLPLQVQKALYGLFITFLKCGFHVSPLSRVSPRYLTAVDSCNLCPERVGSFRPFKSHCLVNGTLTILCGLTDNWVLSLHCCTILTSFWRSSETVFGNFPLFGIEVSSAYPIVLVRYVPVWYQVPYLISHCCKFSNLLPVSEYKLMFFNVVENAEVGTCQMLLKVMTSWNDASAVFIQCSVH